jgi:1,2-dihydroxy-3-keto-5-methylthiopentene dioxygenase
MAVVRIPDQDRVITDYGEAQSFLKSINIDYEIWGSKEIPAGATNEEILAAYSEPIEKLKEQGGYVTADIINVNSETPNLQTMLDKFNKEHLHEEDEVRFCIEGSGVFHIHPENGPITAIEMGKGDLIRVPKGTHHWFDLCETKTIKCIRLFEEASGWAPHYTGSDVAEGYLPVCMGPAFIPSEANPKFAAIPGSGT